MKIQILGTGCAKCKKLAETAEEAAKLLGIDYELEKVTDINDIMKFGVMMTPALVLDGEVKISGNVPDLEKNERNTLMKIKQVITACLLAFIFTSVVLIVIKETKPAAPDVQVKPEKIPAVTTSVEKTKKVSAPQFIVYYFYGNRRCATCKAIESNTRETIDTYFSKQLKSGLLKLETVNVEKPEHEHFIKDYKLTTRSVVISLRKDGKETRFKNLSEVWSFANDKVTFIEYVKGEITKFMDI